MADLMRSTVDVPTAPISMNAPADKSDRTSAVFSKLAGLGAAGTQLYIKEHETSMRRQAMNDLVNDTVNPDLKLHEGAYAQTVAKGEALNSFNTLSADIKNGKYNDTTPTDFQKLLTDGHKAFKEKVSTSKYSALEAESYDDFWLKNESTITAGHAGMYRKNLQMNQAKAMTQHVDALVTQPGITPDEIIEATASVNYSMLTPDDISAAVLISAVNSGDSNILETMNAGFHFDLQKATQATYHAALKAAHKKERAVSLNEAVKLKEEFLGKVKDGTLSDNDMEAYNKAYDENGNKLFSNSFIVSSKIKAEGNRIKQVEKNLVSVKFQKDVDISTDPPKDQTAVVNTHVEALVNAGMSNNDIMENLGKKAKLMSIKIPFVEQFINNIGQFDLTTLQDETTAKAFMETYDAVRVFLASTGGKVSPNYHKYLGEYEARYNDLEFYFKSASGDNQASLQAAAAVITRKEELQGQGIPLQETKDWDNTEFIDDYIDKDNTVWEDVQDIFGKDFDKDVVLSQVLDTTIKKIGKDTGMNQEDSAKKAMSMLDESMVYFAGGWQPMGKEDLKMRLGQDPEDAWRNFIANPLSAQSLDKVFPGREAGAERNPEDYLVTIDAEGLWMTIADKKDPSKVYRTSVDAFKAAANYRATNLDGLANVDALFQATGDDAVKKRNLASADADSWFNSYGLRRYQDNEFVSTYYETPDGKGIPPRVIPTLEEWYKMSDYEKVKMHQSWLNVNFNGSMDWTDTLGEILSVSTVKEFSYDAAELGYNTIKGTGQTVSDIAGSAVSGFKTAEEAAGIPEDQRLSTNIAKAAQYARDLKFKAIDYIGKVFGLIVKDAGAAVPQRQQMQEPEKNLSNTAISDIKEVKIKKGKGVFNNNPGNLRASSLANGKNKGFSTFETPEIGFEALVRQVGLDSGRGDDIEQFISEYAPSNENDTQAYIKFMEDKLGVPKETKLSDLNHIDVARWVAKYESGTELIFEE